MATFFTDLDNTLIYSHKYDITDDFTLIEVLNGCEQGYITKRTLNYLKQNDWFDVVPVTTRTRIQFDRLSDLLQSLGCKHSLIANGAILIVNGEIDVAWFDESLEIFSESLPEINRVKKWLKQEIDIQRVHEEFPFFVYVSVENPNEFSEKMATEVDGKLVNLFIDKKKIYCMPKAMNKGQAVARYIEKFKIQKSVSAGDSLFDYEMLDRTNYAFAPKKIYEHVFNQNKIKIENDEIISDEICEQLDILHKEGLLND